MTNKTHKTNKSNKTYKTYAQVALGFTAIAVLVTGYIVFSQKVERTARQTEHPELELKAIERGRGEERVEAGDTIEIHYEIRLTDGTVVASTYEKDAPFIFTVGDGNVIQAWEIGVEGMRVGEKREIISPASLAYGSGGLGDKVPEDAEVITEIEVLEIR